MKRAALSLVASVSLVVTGWAAPTFREVNDAMGLALWNDNSLWDDTPAEVAARINLPLESQTDSGLSFRRYALGDLRLFGAGFYSLALYATTNRLTEISIMYLNKGDYSGVPPPPLGDAEAWRDWDRARDKKLRGFSAAWRRDRDAIEATLEKLFGGSQRDRFGATPATSETVRRWDWKGHAFLLSAPSRQYIHLRIVSVAVADRGGRVEPVRDRELRERLAARVQRRPNGDVIISQIPMVNQGTKGYCVPATWERYLRFVGVPVDMYWLAVAADTQPGGGTYLDAMMDCVRGVINQSGCRLSRISRALSLNLIREHVDKGLPLMWTMYLVEGLNYNLSLRANERGSVSNWQKWKADLEAHRRPRKTYRLTPVPPLHQCLIIGYNTNTMEVAISDSWGPEFAERWLTVEEAEFVDKREFYVVSW